MNFPGWQAPNTLLEKNGEIAPERMKMLSQSGKDAQLWMCLAVKLKSDAVRKQYCIGTWNVRSMNQGKLEVVKQEMARLYINILGISKLRWTRIGKFNYHIYYCEQKSLRRNRVALIVNKTV